MCRQGYSFRLLFELPSVSRVIVPSQFQPILPANGQGQSVFGAHPCPDYITVPRTERSVAYASRTMKSLC